MQVLAFNEGNRSEKANEQARDDVGAEGLTDMARSEGSRGPEAGKDQILEDLQMMVETPCPPK